MLHRYLLLLALVAVMFTCAPDRSPSGQPMNVLFIAIDDMNDWTKLHDSQNPIEVPNIDRLAASGVFFSQAYCNAPACNPSRASILSGVRPSTSGVYTNASNWKDALTPDMLMPAHFKQHGYTTYCTGKIFHHHGPAHTDYSIFTESNPFPTNGTPDAPMPEGNLNGFEKWHGQDGNSSRDISPNFDWGVWPPGDREHIDEQSVDWALEKLRSPGKPFFMAVGIFRPHMPFYVPDSSYINQYPMSTLMLPVINENDFNDLTQSSIDFIKGYGTYGWMSTFEAEKKRDPDCYDQAVRHYQASCTYADYNVGRLLQALDENGLRNNTIVVLWADHGYHLGEKQHWEKFVLTEKSTHVPYIISVPGMEAARTITYPVSLIDLYPTLSELCGLPVPGFAEGQSLVPILKGEKTTLGKPAIMTYGKNNHAVRSDEYRYIRLADGTEELYHTTADKHEWHNLAVREEYGSVMDSLAVWIPEINADPVARANNASHSHHGDEPSK